MAIFREGRWWCGLYMLVAHYEPKYLPLIATKSHTTIFSSSSRTTLTQTFQNPYSDKPLEEVNYVFPLYDGVSVVGFTCRVGDRVIKGVVKEKSKAKAEYKAAISKGETAGLLEQSPEAADCFKTSVGNIPANAKVEVVVEYLGELKHDAEVDGLRFTIPTNIAPRYGDAGTLSGNVQLSGLSQSISFTVDAEMADGSAIKSVQSPSHPISVNIGTTSMDHEDTDMSLQKASATLSLGEAHLDKDFIIQIVATNLGNPSAILETHPTIPNQRAIMTTLVPKFNLPADKPEIVFICDRSGSMGVGKKIPNLVSALKIFLKSIPVGVKFNICSFGSKWSFLWDRSRTYDQSSLEEATKHVAAFDADFGGTEMYGPMEDTFKRRYKDMNLEVFLMTDGETWDQEKLFKLINDHMKKDKGNTRVFTLGVGLDASSSLIEGVARIGNGFAQTVAENEKMDKKVVRMLKGSLTPHIYDYSLEVKYEKDTDAASDDDFEIVEKVMDSLTIETKPAPQQQPNRASTLLKKISLFDTSSKKDTDKPEKPEESSGDAKYSHLPSLEVPKYLQTPHEIPTLFPFNRTTVYVLLSDATPEKVPKSVILRGTCSHGPLELEIPVTSLPQKGLTIHQLAARKALQELEDGRGWITAAKDQKGKILKEKYDGRFPDMVEREAVRLGVLYQVAGKWCSFVAVEDKGDDKEEQVEDVFHQDETQPVALEHVGFAKSAKRSGGPRMRMARFSSSLSKSSAPVPPPPSGAAINSFGGAPGTSFGATASYSAASYSAAPPPPPTGGALRGGPPRPMAQQAAPAPASRSAPMPSVIGAPASMEKESKKKAKGGMFGGRGGRLGGGGGAADGAGAPALDRSLQSALSSRKASVSREKQEADDSSEEDEEEEGGFMMDEAYAAPELSRRSDTTQFDDGIVQIQEAMDFDEAPAFGSSDPAHEKLAAFQSFIGSWTWTSQLESILGVKKGDAEKSVASSAVAGKDDVLATLCAIVFLKTKCKDERDAWEMIVEKAEAWVESEAGGQISDLEKLVKGLF